MVKQLWQTGILRSISYTLWYFLQCTAGAWYHYRNDNLYSSQIHTKNPYSITTTALLHLEQTHYGPSTGKVTQKL